MSDWTNEPQQTVVSRLTPVPLELRDAIKAGPTDRQTHARHFDTQPTLREIETGGPAAKRQSINGPARILFWNVERLRHIDAIAITLIAEQPDVMLLCEIDRGMARSGNSDRVVDLADRLGMPYAYAVEFIELDLGDINEKRIHAGEINEDGLHGAALLSDVMLHHPFLIRLDRRGDWFDGSRIEPRVGGTIAIGASVLIDGKAVLVVNTHLESHGDPAERCADMRQLLTVIDKVDAKAPVIIGGDFNTSTASMAERRDDPAAWARVLAADPTRLLRPQPHEPLFQLAEDFGYSVDTCNVMDAPTTRYPDGSTRPLAKIDWFFTRGLAASNPRIIPAVQPDGTPSSDHEALIVTVSPL